MLSIAKTESRKAGGVEVEVGVSVMGRIDCLGLDLAYSVTAFFQELGCTCRGHPCGPTLPYGGRCEHQTCESRLPVLSSFLSIANKRIYEGESVLGLLFVVLYDLQSGGSCCGGTVPVLADLYGSNAHLCVHGFEHAGVHASKEVEVWNNATKSFKNEVK